jgi:hypothetical protein
MKWPESRFVLDAEEKVFSFENGYGASLFRYLVPPGKKYRARPWKLNIYHNDIPCYTSPITYDVTGYLNDAEADALLEEIARLPEKIL